MKLEPYISEKPWGGKFLSSLFNIENEAKIGEAFLVSTLINCETKIGNETLSNYLNSKLPYIVKIIDACENLSIQVHPNNDWAKLLENSKGKTECWLVIESENDSGVYYGFKEGHSFASMKSVIDEGGDASKCLNFLPVKKGDFIEVPAGTIHAIGAGVKILEFQQSSGITYRIWDWGREGRELHLDKAKKVTSETCAIPKNQSFYDMKFGMFFKHEDFVLNKLNGNRIECSSPRSSLKFEIDIRDFNCDLSGC